MFGRTLLKSFDLSTPICQSGPAEKCRSEKKDPDPDILQSNINYCTSGEYTSILVYSGYILVWSPLKCVWGEWGGSKIIGWVNLFFS